MLFKRYLLLLLRTQILGEHSSTLYLYTTLFRSSWPRYIMPPHSKLLAKVYNDATFHYVLSVKLSLDESPSFSLLFLPNLQPYAVCVSTIHTYTKPEASTHDLETFSLPKGFQQSMGISSQSLTGFISPGSNSVASLR